MMEPRALAITTGDGYVIKASLYPSAAPRRCAIVCGAMGVKRSFYDAFARFLAGCGITTVTFDYRGIGESRPATLRGFTARMQDWGELDIEAVIAWVRHELAPERLYLVGHSAGGQLVGLAHEARHAHALVMVAAQSGYWGHWRGTQRALVFALWHVLIPLLTRVFGYFPARLLGLGENLPAGVARQWARWGRDPRYLFGRDAPASTMHFAALRMPLLAISILHDRFAPRAAVEAWLAWFPNAAITLREIGLRNVRNVRIDHFNWFRAEAGLPFWRELVEWLDGQG
ncbi:MAG TPA: alpha/beta fold hydrolase [Gammaproteobacteria bacterium]|nr:alpha/beta fold hydrolase [Gammaproteobacteria bacterium]